MPSNSPNDRQVAPLLATAAQMLKAGRQADAIALLREAAMLQPANAIIQHDFGLTCLEAGCLPEAVAALKHATDNPRDTDAYFRLGIAFEKQGDIRAAILA